MVLDVNITVCEKFSVLLKNPFRSKKKNNVLRVMDDINVLLENPDFSKEFLGNHLLNKGIQISTSEYGFIGLIRDHVSRNEETKEIERETYLKTIAITNIAWNLSSFEFYKEFVNSSFQFRNLDATVFGQSILNKKPIIVNKYDNTRNVLPPGHPPIRRFMGVPIVINGKVMLYIGMCNKLSPYKKSDYKEIQKILKVVGVTLYIMKKFNDEKLQSQSDLNQFISKTSSLPPSPPPPPSSPDILRCPMFGSS